ncbi:hypothetical protein PSM7751_00847 [Pseudooceanicola marinus]|uniref:Major capsid protein n=1 Tax=Pseudooceanicola marinus TaxID=396013 RepID=A0A1X6YMB9_9RHOB|nr:hypothetical protein [Pseudooceanicola marinus]PJE29342.1 hypothetical protein CVM50_12570 [Pseudooceanicola marinus]SLN24709.1 hypothetical protein PSM7751_00847 [Pseudooceanicola marinus]
MNYQTPRGSRREQQSPFGKFRAGKLNPVMMFQVRGSEGGYLSQEISMWLDPIVGRLVTPITAEFISVFVPAQAMDAIKDPDAAYAGMTEVLREKLRSGNPLFDLEDDNEIAQRCGVVPRPIGGQLKVSESVRLCHNAAVNFLRQRKYVKASTVLHSNTAITPALIGQTVLDRLNGVLDPEDRVNGAVKFDMSDVPVKGIGMLAGGSWDTNVTTREADGSDVVYERSASGNNVEMLVNSGKVPQIYADMSNAAGEVSLTDFYNAETMDRLTRTMRKIVDDNPEYGEEMALNWALGLSMDSGKIPFIISRQEKTFGRNIVPATDSAGVQTEVLRSDSIVQMSFTVPIPRTELGGNIITFAVVKPDETLGGQPHPYLSDVWGAENFVADELALDPVPVTFRDLDYQVDPGQENTVAFYVGNNGLKRTYVNYGLTRNLDPETVENKNAIWQHTIPLSVSPDSVLYPEDLPQDPFLVTDAEVCSYILSHTAVVKTPTIFGPTPVEELAVLEDENVFGDNEE